MADGFASEDSDGDNGQERGAGQGDGDGLGNRGWEGGQQGQGRAQDKEKFP